MPTPKLPAKWDAISVMGKKAGLIATVNGKISYRDWCFGERSRMATHGIVARVFETDDSCCLIRKAKELYQVVDKEADHV